MRSLLQIVVLCVLTGLCPGGPYILIDRDLNETRVELVQIRDSGLLVRDDASRRVAMDRFVAIVHADRTPETAPGGTVVQLADGQRLVGESAPLGRGESVRVLLRSRAEVTAPLESVRWIRLTGAGDLPASASPPSEDPFEDVVILSNRDRLRGFVLGIEGETLRIETGAGERAVSLSETAWIVLSTPRAIPTGPMLWLADGSVLAAESLASESPTEVVVTLRGIGGGESSSGSRSGAQLRLDRDEVLAVVPDPSALAPLALVEGVTATPANGRRWAPLPVGLDLGVAVGDLASLEVSGPSEVRWPLPDNARRLGATIEALQAGRAWADGEVVVLATRGRGQEAMPLARVTMDPHSGPTRVRAGLPQGRGRELIVRVEAGRYGPVHSGAVLRRAVLLLDD